MYIGSRRSPGLYAILALSLFATAGVCSAQHSPYPAKPVRLVVGFAPGGPTDVVARAFADHASRSLGQPFVVDNKPGANTIIAAQAVASAAADGYTLLFGATNHTMIPALYSGRVKFDAIRSFEPVCTVATSPAVLVVGQALPVKTLAAYLQKARHEPGRITVGSPGVGSSGHFALEMFSRASGVRLNHVPYKGAAQVVTDLLGGQIDSSFATVGSVLAQVRSGQLTAIAVASSARSPLLPNVPTFAEAGGHGFSADAWYGVLAPAGVPQSVMQTLEKVAKSFSGSETTVAKLRGLGMETASLCGEQFAAQLRREVATYTGIARELQIKAD